MAGEGVPMQTEWPACLDGGPLAGHVSGKFVNVVDDLMMGCPAEPVPEISRFLGIVITRSFNDHEPLLSHVRCGEHQVGHRGMPCGSMTNFSTSDREVGEVPERVSEQIAASNNPGVSRHAQPR